MELTVLGADGTYARAGGGCSGYLVEEEGFGLLLDAGSGTLAALQERRSLASVGGVFLSHLHPDHCTDLYLLFHALAYGPETASPVPIVAPTGARERLGGLLSEDARERFAQVFAWHELDPGGTFDMEPFRLATFESRHSTMNLTLRITAGKTEMCFSGDTGPNDGLTLAARSANLFLCESTWLERDTVHDQIHMRARQAGHAARVAGAQRLVLTHVAPWNEPIDAQREAADTFGSTPLLARRGETMIV